MTTEQEHKYDATGVCIYCDRCPNPSCCPPQPCDRRTWTAVTESLDAVIARLNEGT